MTVASSRVLVALVALAVVTLVPTAGATSSTSRWAGVAAVVLAVALAVVQAPREATFVALAGLALVVASHLRMDTGGVAARWWGLALLPTVLPLAGLALVRGRWPAWFLAAGALVAGPVRVLGYDPFLDPACRGCRGLPTLWPLSAAGGDVMALVGGTVVLLGLLDGLRRGPARLPLVGLVVATAWSLSGWSGPRGVVPEAATLAVLVAGTGAMDVLVRIVVARTHLQRVAVALASGNAPQASLARTLGDASLTVDFAVGPGDQPVEWVDAVGLPSSGPAPNQVTTPVRLGAETVARVHHVPDSGRADLLATSLTPELRLAIEHARLTARLDAQVRQLHESRVRVVEAADETRRRLERDLHDGAQQELLALGFDVRRALATAPRDPCLARCVDEVSGALEDLRTLASGVHPALLSAAGLGPALEQAGSRGPYDVRTGPLPEQRFAPAVERTAYLLVMDMASRGPVEVTGRLAGGSLRLTATGAPLPAGSVVPERVAALGGTLVEGPGRTEVTMPCG